MKSPGQSNWRLLVSIVSDDQTDGFPLLQGKAERIGFIQPGKEKALV